MQLRSLTLCSTDERRAPEPTSDWALLPPVGSNRLHSGDVLVVRRANAERDRQVQGGRAASRNRLGSSAAMETGYDLGGGRIALQRGALAVRPVA
jgi:hypothetical protein